MTSCIEFIRDVPAVFKCQGIWYPLIHCERMSLCLLVPKSNRTCRVGTSMTINQFIRIIRGLRSDEPCIDPSKWYTTQKEHWLGWLGEYHGPGAYGRQTIVKRDARYAYNHIVESKMLLWLIEAAGVRNGLIISARRACKEASSLQQKSAAIRKHICWDELETALLSKKKLRNVRRART